MHVVGESMNDIYRQLCGKISVQGKEVAGTRELLNSGFTLLDITDNVASVRKGFSATYMLGEMLWYWNARSDVEFISKFSKFWQKISDDDETNSSAYGDIVFNRYGFDQMRQVIDTLKKDPTSRRALINFNVPNPKRFETKDEICTIALVFELRDGKLDCTCIMRSNDIWLGTPYDVVFFTTLQRHIADRLGVGYGKYTHYAVSLHAYERNIADVREVWSQGRLFDNGLVFDFDKFIFYYKEMAREVDRLDADAAKEYVVDFASKHEIIGWKVKHED